jgi:hypothetical protein
LSTSSDLDSHLVMASPMSFSDLAGRRRVG